MKKTILVMSIFFFINSKAHAFEMGPMAAGISTAAAGLTLMITALITGHYTITDCKSGDLKLCCPSTNTTIDLKDCSSQNENELC